MTVNMEEPDTLLHRQVVGHTEMWASGNSVLQVDTELTHDVIEGQDSRDTCHVVIQRLTQRIIHIHLSS